MCTSWISDLLTLTECQHSMVDDAKSDKKRISDKKGVSQGSVVIFFGCGGQVRNHL